MDTNVLFLVTYERKEKKNNSDSYCFYRGEVEGSHKGPKS